MGAKSGSTLGMTSVCQTPSRAMLDPAASVTSQTWPSRAMTSCILLTVLSKSASVGAITTTGTVLSTSAMGPCFSSPDA